MPDSKGSQKYEWFSFTVSNTQTDAMSQDGIDK
jgi:hypothetical protein